MEISAEGIWVVAQDRLRSKLSLETYNLWFASLRARSLDPHSLVLEVANEFCGIWLQDNYSDLLKDALANASGRCLEVRFEVGSTCASAEPRRPEHLESKRAESAARSKKRCAESVFDPRNRFETFVVGDNNSSAHAAAQAVAETPGKVYNPLFLYGGVGLGKTHLLHAIGQHVWRHNPGLRVAYLPAEQFTNAWVEAMQDNRLGQFRRKCREIDMLLVDDVQFLQGKRRIQEEFYYTINQLHEARKQIVVTCDRRASQLLDVEQRLVSRFERGLVTELQPPDGEMRLALLRKKVALMNVELPEEIMAFLANRVRTNIRRLEGALNRVVSYARLTGRKLSLEVVESLLREILQEEGHHAIDIEAIQRKVAEHFDLRLADMTSKRRPENIAFPRQIAMYFSRRMTESSLNTIGEAFGGRDHGTVLHACRLVKERMEVDFHVRRMISHLEMKLSG